MRETLNCCNFPLFFTRADFLVIFQPDKWLRGGRVALSFDLHIARKRALEDAVPDLQPALRRGA